MKRITIRVFVVTLLVLTASVTFTAAAQAWKRGQDAASDPENRGAAYNDKNAIVCQNGVTVQVASSDRRRYVLVVRTGTVEVASRRVRLKKRPVETPPIGRRKYSGTFRLSYSLPVGAIVDIGFEGFDTFQATVQDCCI